MTLTEDQQDLNDKLREAMTQITEARDYINKVQEIAIFIGDITHSPLLAASRLQDDANDLWQEMDYELSTLDGIERLVCQEVVKLASSSKGDTPEEPA